MQARKLLFIAAAALAALPAYAQPFPGGHRCGAGEHGVESMARHLDLSKAQRQALRDIEDKYRPRQREVRDRLDDTRQAMAGLKAGDAKLREAADAHGKAVADMIVLRAQVREDMDQVLTDAQREKLRRRRDEMGHGPAHHGN